MNTTCIIGSIVMFCFVAYCIIENHLILAFLLSIGACEMTYHAVGMIGDHYTDAQIELIKRDAIEEYKKEPTP